MPLAIPKTADELEAAVGDTGTRNEILKSQESLVAFIKGFAEQNVNRATVDQQVTEQVDKRFADIFRANNLGDVPGMINRLNLDPNAPAVKNRKYTDRAPGKGLDAMFPDWGSYLGATRESRATTIEALENRAKIQKIQNAFGSTVPADGGFLIPETLRSELLRVAIEMAMVRSRARVVPMEALTVPYPMIDSTTNSGSVYGGVTGYWAEERQTLTDSSPNFGRITLLAKKLTLYSEIPNELFTDSLISLLQFLDEVYPEALAWFEDLAFISGNGVGQPQGFLNALAAVSVTAESGQPSSTVVWENVVKMYSRMLPSSLGRAFWVANLDTFPEIATMGLSVGTGGSAVYIGDGQGAGAPPVNILGRPVLWTEKVPGLGTLGDLNFVDFGYYLIGDRQVMQSTTSEHFKFNQDVTALRLTERVDGQPWIQSAITPAQGSNTLSPFVKLAARP